MHVLNMLNNNLSEVVGLAPDLGYDVDSSLDSSDIDSTESPSRKYPARLLQIFQALQEQCHKQMEQVPPYSGGEPFCARDVDTWGGCWPDTVAGTTAQIPCPDIPGLNTQELATRLCTADGTWKIDNSTGRGDINYTLCRMHSDQFDDGTLHIYIFVGGFSLSLVMLIIALFIFFWFKQLRCDRITIHKNLFLSYTCTGVSWILYYVLVALDGQVMLDNPMWCRVLHVLCHYFTVCNFLWMFCEGLYLNTIMTYAFSSGRLLLISCYCIGWGLPVVLTTIYTAIRGANEEQMLDCWIELSALQWIMFGPIVLSIVINFIFLINIVRLLITKLRQMPEVTQTKKATRATLILVPLLGLQYVLIPFKPPPGSQLEEAYHIVVALVTSLQGGFVSIMYCFCNGEVIAVMSRKYTQRRLMRKRSSIKSTSGHLGTAYTTIDNITAQNNYNNVTNNHETRILETRFVERTAKETDETDTRIV